MSLTRYLLVLICLISTNAFADSKSVPKQIPPISDQTEGAHKPQNNSKPQQSVSISFPSTINTTVSGKLYIESQNDKSKENEEPINWSEWIIAGFTGLLVFFTAGLVNFTKKLWGSTNDLVKDAKETSQKELRAYIAVDTATKRDAIGGIIPNSIALDIRNVGKTPAHNLKTWVDSDIFEHPFTGELRTPPKESVMTSSVRNPGCSILLMPDIPTIDDTVRRGDRAIYVWGGVSYEDVFGNEWVTEFCYFMDSEGFKQQRFAYYMDKNTAT